MKLRDLHKWVTYVFAGLGLLALTLGTDLGVLPSAALALGFVASWFFEGPRVYARATSVVLTVVALGVFAVDLVRFFALGEDGVALAVEYAGLLQLTRLFHRKTSTEHLHVVGLGFLHLLAGTLLSTGLDYAAVFLGFVVATPWMLSLTHLRAELERTYAKPAELEHEPTGTLARMLDSKHLASRGFLAASSLLSLPLFAIVALFFLLFPRVGLGMFTFGDDRGPAVAGFGDRVDLGTFGSIRNDVSVVARVYPARVAQPPAPTLPIRLRGAAFDVYDGVVWTRDARVGDRRIGRYAPIPLGSRRIPAMGAEQLRLVVEAVHEGVVFVPTDTIALGMRSHVERGVEIAPAVYVRHGYDVRLVEDDGLPLDYVAYLKPGTDVREARLSKDDVATLLEVPDAVSALVPLARRIAPDERDPLVLARALESHFREGPFRYTTSPSDPGEANPLVHFVTRSRRGHCELFASALAVFLRARGIPATNVTGYLGARYNAYGQYYAVRAGDAHSWVEAYIDGRFVTLDPTPPDREATAPESDALTPLRELLDAMRVRWSRDVVGYDMRRQLDGLISLARGLRGSRLDRSVRSFARDERGRTNPRKVVSGLAFMCFGTIGGVTLLALGVRWLIARRRRGPAPPPLAALYAELDALLAAQGHARPPHHTPDEHLRSLRAAAHPAVEAIATLTAAHDRVRYGGAEADAQELVQLRGALEQVRANGPKRR